MRLLPPYMVMRSREGTYESLISRLTQLLTYIGNLESVATEPKSHCYLSFKQDIRECGMGCGACLRVRAGRGSSCSRSTLS
jgi:hypothetical protein